MLLNLVLKLLVLSLMYRLMQLLYLLSKLLMLQTVLNGRLDFSRSNDIHK